MMARILRARLPLSPAAAARARRFLEPFLEDLDPHSSDSVRLLVSELVSNSVKHSGRPEGDPILLTVDLRGDAVRAEVVDRGAGVDLPLSALPRPDTGWGLYLVDRLADDWGYSREGPTRVWFEVST
jgi:anti-sigma regulatory factor (Ser/Thr protein kinase)